MYQREEFSAYYHKRSNVESTFSMIKAKFCARIRSKTPVAQVNEVLCEVLCIIYAALLVRFMSWESKRLFGRSLS